MAIVKNIIYSSVEEHIIAMEAKLANNYKNILTKAKDIVISKTKK